MGTVLSDVVLKPIASLISFCGKQISRCWVFQGYISGYIQDVFCNAPAKTQWNTSVIITLQLQWRHNERNGVSNHQPQDCSINCLFRRRSKKISKLCVTDHCEGNSPVTSEFLAQRASNAENFSIWWRHYEHITLWGFIFRWEYISILWHKNTLEL